MPKRIGVMSCNTDECCRGCTERSVEPLCRTTCEKWQRHEEQKRIRYEEAERRSKYLDDILKRRKK